MQWLNYKPVRREDGGRSVWSTSLIFLTLVLLTLIMILAVKGMVTGSVRPF